MSVLIFSVSLLSVLSQVSSYLTIPILCDLCLSIPNHSAQIHILAAPSVSSPPLINLLLRGAALALPFRSGSNLLRCRSIMSILAFPLHCKSMFIHSHAYQPKQCLCLSRKSYSGSVQFRSFRVTSYLCRSFSGPIIHRFAVSALNHSMP